MKIMPISKETMLLGCDISESMGVPKFVAGNNFAICVTAASKNEASRIFNALSKGGMVTMPLEKTFWSPFLGMLNDKFGISWMIDCERE